MKSNIVLIGMPGAGKSTVGVLLAKALNYDFVDADLIIQTRNNKKLYEIIEEKGIDEFLNIENNTIASINVNKSVIATGGSAIFGEAAMNHMKENGIVVYLKLSCNEICKRLCNIKTRGVVMKKGKTILDVYTERIPLYEKYADITIDAEGTNVEECVAMVATEIINNS